MPRVLDKLRRAVTALGPDGLLLVLVGVTAISLSLFDLVGGNQLSPPLLVAVLGALLLETVLFRLRFANSIDAVKGEVDDTEARISQRIETLSTQIVVQSSQLERMEGVIAGKLGGDNFLKDQSEYDSLAQLTSTATDVIIIGSSMTGLVQLYLPTLRLLLRRGCKIRVVLQDPTLGSDSHAANSNRTINLLTDIRNSGKEHLEVRLVRRIIHHSILGIDCATRSGRITVTLYPNIGSADERVHFDLTPSATPKWYEYWHKAMNEIWQEARVHDFTSDSSK